MTPYYIMKKSMILLKVKDWVLRGKMKSTLRIPSQILAIFKEEEKDRKKSKNSSESNWGC